MIFSDREARRRRLLNRAKWYNCRERHNIADALLKQVRQLPIGGILPDITENLVAHCGQWHVITKVPLIVACCGAVLFTQDQGHI